MVTEKFHKRFVLKAIIFICAFFLLNGLFKQLFIDKVLIYTNLYRSDRQFQTVKNQVKILIAGDSHPRADISPKLIENSFIVAYGGENTILTYYRLSNYVEDQNLNIDTVLLPYDLHTFSDYRKNTYGENGMAGASWWSEYIDYFDLCTGMDTGLNFSCWLKRAEAEFPYRNGIGKTKNFINIKSGKSGFSKIEDGSLPAKGDFSQESAPVEKALTRARGHLSNYNVMDDDLIVYYIRTIKMLKKNGVNVVLVRYPVTNPYYRMAARIIDVEVYYSKIGELMFRKGIDVPVLDYHDLYWRQNEKFSDPDHLNLDAAKEFTFQVRNDLVDLGYFNK